MTEVVKSLYEKNPDIWDRIIKAGNPSIGELSKIMSRASQLDRALGVTNSAGYWISGRTHPTAVMEAKALAYIENDYKPVNPVAKKPASENGKVVLIVTINKPSKAAGIAAFLKSIDCEVVEL